MVTPLEVAGAFATIVGLVADFVAHRKAGESQTQDEFFDWLRRHEHQEVIEQLENNQALTAAIRSLLNNQHTELMSAIRHIDAMLFSVASHLEEFRAVTDAVVSAAVLSDQAVSILRQMNKAQSGCIIEIRRNSGPKFITYTGTRVEIEVPEQTFVESDLQDLQNANCLTPDFGSSGSRMFHITRLGSAIGGQTTTPSSDGQLPTELSKSKRAD